MNIFELRKNIAQYLNYVTGLEVFQVPQDVSKDVKNSYFTINLISDEFVGFPTKIFDYNNEIESMKHLKTTSLSIRCLRVLKNDELLTKEHPTDLLNKVLKAEFFKNNFEFLFNKKIAIKSTSNVRNLDVINRSSYEYIANADVNFQYNYIESNQQNKMNNGNFLLENEN